MGIRTRQDSAIHLSFDIFFELRVKYPTFSGPNGVQWNIPISSYTLTSPVAFFLADRIIIDFCLTVDRREVGQRILMRAMSNDSRSFRDFFQVCHSGWRGRAGDDERKSERRSIWSNV